MAAATAALHGPWCILRMHMESLLVLAPPSIPMALYTARFLVTTHPPPLQNMPCAFFVLYTVGMCIVDAASRGRVLRSAGVARAAHFEFAACAVAFGIATVVMCVLQGSTVLFLDATKNSTTVYDHGLPREDCAADIQCGIRMGVTWLIGYIEDEVWDHIMAPIGNLQCQALKDHGTTRRRAKSSAVSCGIANTKRARL